MSAHDDITSTDLTALGLLNLEFRYYGTPDPDAERNDDTCDMWSVTVYVNGAIDSGPHCDDSVAEDGSGELEGIGGAYADGSTFSYISDDSRLCDRFCSLLITKGS